MVNGMSYLRGEMASEFHAIHLPDSMTAKIQTTTILMLSIRLSLVKEKWSTSIASGIMQASVLSVRDG